MPSLPIFTILNFVVDTCLAWTNMKILFLFVFPTDFSYIWDEYNYRYIFIQNKKQSSKNSEPNQSKRSQLIKYRIGTCLRV